MGSGAVARWGGGEVEVEVEAQGLGSMFGRGGAQEQIGRLLGSGELDGMSLVWREGMAQCGVERKCAGCDDEECSSEESEPVGDLELPVAKLAVRLVRPGLS